MNKYNEAMNRIKVDDDMRSRIMNRLESEAKNGPFQGVDADKVVSIESKRNNVYRFRQIARAAAVVVLLIAGFGAASLVLGRFGSRDTMESATMSDSVAETAEEYAYEETAEATEEAAAEYEEPTLAAGDSEDMAKETEALPDSDFAIQGAANGVKTEAAEESEESIEGAIWKADKYDTAEELAKASGIDIKDVESIKEKADETAYIHLYSSNIVEIQYQIGTNRISLRKAQNSTGVDLTGNYEIYDDKKNITVEGVTCDVEGSGDIFYQATWSDGTYNYSFFDLDGRSQSDMEEILKEIISNN